MTELSKDAAKLLAIVRQHGRATFAGIIECRAARELEAAGMARVKWADGSPQAHGGGSGWIE